MRWLNEDGVSAALSNLVIIFAALKGSGKVIDPIQAGDVELSA